MEVEGVVVLLREKVQISLKKCMKRNGAIWMCIHEIIQMCSNNQSKLNYFGVLFSL